MDALKRFHKRAIRHITGCHIRQKAQGKWTYQDHAALLNQCGLWPINVYIERRQGTLCKYLEENKMELLADMEDLLAPAWDPHQVLWWRQPWITQERMQEMELPAS